MYVDALVQSLEVRNVSFARISMFSNGTLSSAAAGGINVNTNVIARLQAMLTCACRRYTIDSFFADRRNGDFQHDGLQLREHHTCCCRRKLYNHGRRAPVSVPCFVCVFDMQLYCCCRLLLRALLLLQVRHVCVCVEFKVYRVQLNLRWGALCVAELRHRISVQQLQCCYQPHWNVV